MIVRGFKIEPGAELRDADLSGADLRDADLRDADLSGADLSGADLSGAYFIKTKLTSDQLMWLTLTGQITPDQANQCKVLKTQELLTY